MPASKKQCWVTRFLAPHRDTPSIVFSTTTQPLPGNGHAIMIRISTAHTILPPNTKLQTMACRVGITNTFTICILYLHSNENPPIQDLINQLPPPFLILGDINGRHPSWDGDRTDQHGLTVESLFLNNDINILNTGSMTHFHV